MKHFAFAVLCIACVASAQTPIHNDELAVDPTAAETAVFDAAPANLEWDRYVDSLKGVKLQKDCKPVRISPPAGVPVRGKIVAVHGYTACPQQYLEWADRMAAKGIVVYLTLLPGHGRKQKDGKDVIVGLPEDDGADYHELAESMIKIADADPLPTTAVGLSVGGAVALDAVETSPKSFKKMLLYSPFFTAADPLVRKVITAGGFGHVSRYIRIGWGDTCRDEMVRKRQGICDFSIGQLNATQQYGRRVQDGTASAEAKKAMANVKVQIVGATGDPAAAVSNIANAARNLGLGSSANVSACLYRKGANHSLLSRFDGPKGQDKFWLNSALRDSVAFVADDQNFPTEAGGEEGITGCRIAD